MSRRHKHRRQSGRSRLLATVKGAFGDLAACPLRAGLLLCLGLALVWVVLTKSLPYALAPVAPGTALILNPNNPAALIAKAEKIRDRLLALMSESHAEFQETDATEQRGNTLVHLSEAKTPHDVEASPMEREALRHEIRELASRAIAADPLNAEAFRLLAEVTGDPEQVRELMQKAVNRSRRESIALFWLLNDSYYRKDFEAALDQADILLRTRPELANYVFAYLALIAEDPTGVVPLIKKLAAGPSWRGPFFQALPRNMRQVNTPFLIMTALGKSGKPPHDNELAPYLDFLINKNLHDLAYNIWLRFLPKNKVETLALIENGSFESNPSGLPFDWQIAPGINAIAELASFEPDGKWALHISFGTGRVRFPEVSEVVVLAPGHYHLEGKLRGTIIAKRGLRWQLRCASGARTSLGETEMLVGQFQEWLIFSLEADVPPTKECRGQMLRLFHDSRSASEELISGEVWFDELSLRRVSDLSEAAK
jgi:hypothetical protein